MLEAGRVELVIDGVGAHRVEQAQALLGVTERDVAALEAVRRRGEELVGPAVELVKRRERRGEAAHAVAFHVLRNPRPRCTGGTCR